MSVSNVTHRELNIPFTRAQVVTVRTALQHAASLASAYANQNLMLAPIREQYQAEANAFDALDAYLAELLRQDANETHRHQVVYKHHPDCPFGENGLRGYWEARDALSNYPPEALRTQAERDALYEAEMELERLQVCNCGMES